MSIDIWGHVFYVVLLCGNFLISKRRISGWICRFVGEIGWAILGLLLGLTSIWAWGFLFCAFDAYGFYQWKKTDLRTEVLAP